jgi:hypothetical protein
LVRSIDNVSIKPFPNSYRSFYFGFEYKDVRIAGSERSDHPSVKVSYFIQPALQPTCSLALPLPIMFDSKIFSIASFLAFVSSVASAVIEKRAVADNAVTFQTIFVPPSNYITLKTLYGRTAQLSNGDLLATW